MGALLFCLALASLLSCRGKVRLAGCTLDRHCAASPRNLELNKLFCVLGKCVGCKSGQKLLSKPCLKCVQGRFQPIKGCCSGDGMCRLGEKCLKNRCHVECSRDDPCLVGQKCLKGVCILDAECTVNPDCRDPVKPICQLPRGKCRVECGGPFKCRDGMVCRAHRCEDECNAQYTCPKKQICVEGRCREKHRRVTCKFGRIAFGVGRWKISKKHEQILRRNAECIRQHPDRKVRIIGFCDERGSAKFNLALGNRRANGVKKYLVSLGIPASNMVTMTKGEREPLEVCVCSKKSAWSKNRRVEVSFEE